MNALATAASPRTENPTRAIAWFPLAVFALVWLEVISRLRFEWSINPQYGYGWSVPVLAAYVFWRRWECAPAPTAPRASAFWISLIILAALFLIPVRLIQEANPDWRLLSWAMALCAVAISAAGVYLAGGAPWLRHFVFPILFFLVAVPWPTSLETIVIQGLMRVDARINVEILTAIGIPAVQLGNVIEVGSGYVGIDEACTGIRSLQATFMTSLFLGEYYAFSARRRVILVAAGALLAFICNLIRTFLLVYLGAEHGFQSIKNWHDPAGYTILTICLLGLWGVSILLSRKDEALPEPRKLSTPHRIPRLVLGVLLAATLAAEAGTQLWYGIHETRATQVVPWSIESDICLPASGMTQRGGVQNKLLRVNGVPLPMRSYIFENGGQLLHVFYCYWDATPPEAGMLDQENWTPAGRLDAVRRGKRDVGTQMLEIVAWGYDDAAKAEAAALDQLRQIIRPG